MPLFGAMSADVTGTGAARPETQPHGDPTRMAGGFALGAAGLAPASPWRHGTGGAAETRLGGGYAYQAGALVYRGGQASAGPSQPPHPRPSASPAPYAAGQAHSLGRHGDCEAPFVDTQGLFSQSQPAQAQART